MKWLLKRFKYVRELEDRVRELGQEVHAHEVIEKFQKEIISDWEDTETNFSRMNLGELEVIMTSIVEYQRCLQMLHAADPIEARVAPIFEKYNITWERNTLVDRVIKEAEEYARKNAGGSSAND